MTSFSVVFGAAGSGKTHFLVEQVADYTAKGARVLCLSHTKVAAAEMKSRIVENMELVEARTMHSLIYGLVGVDYRQVVTKKRLVEFGHTIGVNVSGDFDINGETEREITEGDEALSIMARAHAKMVEPLDEFDASDRPLARATFQYISRSYDNWKRAKAYVDFNDMLLLYLQRPVSIAYDVLISDETQDYSELQWRVLEALSKSVQHVICAGDPAQAIYLWGGAKSSGMTDFATKMDAHTYRMPKSYRVPKSVHTVAMKIMANFQRGGAHVYEPRDAEGNVEKYSDPANIVFDDVDTLVLYRTHSLRRELEANLIESYTPYLVLNGLKDPWHSRYGAAVTAFNKACNDIDTITAKEKTLLDRYCFARTLKPEMDWWDYLDIPQKYADYMRETEGKQANVRLSTIHGAKGMEAERVVLYSGITQRVLDGMVYDADAEHKVFYVGVTRAKNRLDIVEGEGNSYEVL